MVKVNNKRGRKLNKSKRGTSKRGTSKNNWERLIITTNGAKVASQSNANLFLKASYYYYNLLN